MALEVFAVCAHGAKIAAAGVTDHFHNLESSLRWMSNSSPHDSGCPPYGTTLDGFGGLRAGEHSKAAIEAAGMRQSTQGLFQPVAAMIGDRAAAFAYGLSAAPPIGDVLGYRGRLWIPQPYQRWLEPEGPGHPRERGRREGL